MIWKLWLILGISACGSGYKSYNLRTFLCNVCIQTYIISVECAILMVRIMRMRGIAHLRVK